MGWLAAHEPTSLGSFVLSSGSTSACGTCLESMPAIFLTWRPAWTSILNSTCSVVHTNQPKEGCFAVDALPGSGLIWLLPRVISKSENIRRNDKIGDLEDVTALVSYANHSRQDVSSRSTVRTECHAPSGAEEPLKKPCPLIICAFILPYPSYGSSGCEFIRAALALSHE